MHLDMEHELKVLWVFHLVPETGPPEMTKVSTPPPKITCNMTVNMQVFRSHTARVRVEAC